MIRLTSMEIDDLPGWRQIALEWRYALLFDGKDARRAGVSALMREAKETPCSIEWGMTSIASAGASCAAVLGEDSRYHLTVDGRPYCAAKRKRADPPELVRHEYDLWWWTDGTRYTVQAPADAVGPDGLIKGVQGRRTVEWTLTLADTVMEPASVPSRMRCVHRPSRIEWPPYADPTTREGRQRARLIAELGAMCHGCGCRLAAVTDHNHFKSTGDDDPLGGLIRGLLCHHCNSHIDSCLHVSGCRWADYLNNPPAAHLRMYYTKLDAALRKPSAIQRIEKLGFDPLYRPDRKGQQHRLPPPQHGAAGVGGDQPPLF